MQFDEEEESESRSEGDALVEENLSDIEVTNGEKPELWSGEDGENVEELTRANSMSWFGAGPNISRVVKNVPEHAGLSDDMQSLDEECWSRPNEDALYRRNYIEFNEKDLETNKKIRFEKLLRFKDLD